MAKMETRIKITSDNGGVYESGTVVTAMDFIQAYLDTTDDTWVTNIPIASAVAYIADAWGVEFEYI